MFNNFVFFAYHSRRKFVVGVKDVKESAWKKYVIYLTLKITADLVRPQYE